MLKIKGENSIEKVRINYPNYTWLYFTDFWEIFCSFMFHCVYDLLLHINIYALNNYHLSPVRIQNVFFVLISISLVPRKLLLIVLSAPLTKLQKLSKLSFCRVWNEKLFSIFVLWCSSSIDIMACSNQKGVGGGGGFINCVTA